MVYENKTKPSKSPKKAIGPSQKRKRCLLQIQKDIDDEEIESDDPNQYKVVSTKLEVDILCDKIKNNVDLSDLKKFHFEKLSKDDKTKIEESIYQMLWTFKKVPMEIIEKLPRRLSIGIDQRWSMCLVKEREVREAKLAKLFSNLKHKEIKRNIESYRKKIQS